MKLKHIAAAAILAVSGSAFAASYDFGAHDQLESSGLVGLSGGAFGDTYTFTLAAQSTVASAAQIFGGFGSYSLFSGDALPGGLADTQLFSFNFGTAANSVSLAAGSYFYVISGLTFGPGVYTLNSSAVAAPVPEPETYALMLAGLGIVGFMAARRKQS